ncbi:MAG: hypothetical protein AB1696_27990 [Planctomycetota bacterium]
MTPGRVPSTKPTVGARPGLTPGMGSRPGLVPGSGTKPGLQPGAGSRPGPTPGQLSSSRPGAGVRPEVRKPGLKPAGAIRPGGKPGERPTRPGTWPAKPGDWRGYHQGDYHRHCHWRHGRYRPWAWVTWGALCGWIGYSSAPEYYDYGVDDGYVYNGETQVAPVDQYAQQATEIADAAQEQPENADWMPLGVFGIAPQQGQAVQAALQLASTKDGTIGGTYYNSAEGAMLSVAGSIDQQTQQAAWKVGEEDAVVMETGIGNFTKDVSTILLHFPGGVTESWVMTRMDQQTAKKMEDIVEGNTELRKKLAESARKLEGKLDDQWRSYLALPEQVFEGDNVPDIGDLHTAQRHFDLVKANDQCREMAELPEFKQTRDLLAQYIKELTS